MITVRGVSEPIAHALWIMDPSAKQRSFVPRMRSINSKWMQICTSWILGWVNEGLNQWSSIPIMSVLCTDIFMVLQVTLCESLWVMNSQDMIHDRVQLSSTIVKTRKINPDQPERQICAIQILGWVNEEVNDWWSPSPTIIILMSQLTMQRSKTQLAGPLTSFATPLSLHQRMIQVRSHLWATVRSRSLAEDFCRLINSVTCKFESSILYHGWHCTSCAQVTGPAMWCARHTQHKWELMVSSSCHAANGSLVA